MAYDDWHFNVRSSNTEPLLRLNLESLRSEQDMERRRDEVLEVIRGDDEGGAGMAEIEIDGVRFRVRVDHDAVHGQPGVRERTRRRCSWWTTTPTSRPPSRGELDPALADAVREAVGDCPQDAIILERIG